MRRPVPDAGRRARPGRGRLPHRRHQGRRRGPLAARRSPRPPRPADRGAARLPATPSRWCSRGLFPIDGDDFEDLRESLEKLKLNDASITLHAGDLGRARLRVPLRLPRPAAHGDRQGAARARVRPRPDRHRAERRVPRAPHRRRRSIVVDNPADLPDPQQHRLHRGAVLQGRDHHADGLHGHADGAVPARAAARWTSSSTCRPSGSSCTT